jgi:hypothetical protein
MRVFLNPLDSRLRGNDGANGWLVVASFFYDLEIMGDRGGLAEHDGRRATTRWVRSARCGSAKQASNRLSFYDLEIMGDRGGLAEHDGRRATTRWVRSARCGSAKQASNRLSFYDLEIMGD